MAEEPRAVLERAEVAGEPPPRPAELDVAAPASVARLDDDGRAQPRPPARDDALGARVREAAAFEHGGGEQLVVRAQERPDAVEDADAARLGPPQGGKTRLDAVERLQEVETAEEHVAGPEPLGVLGPDDDRREPAVAPRLGEPLVRRVGRAENADDPLHGGTVAALAAAAIRAGTARRYAFAPM